MKRTTYAALAIILAGAALSAYFYPQMPEKMATHWNAAGTADGYTAKDAGLAIMPTISLLLLALFLFIPGIDPLKKNIEMFRPYYDRFIVLMLAFLLYLHALMILWNLKFGYNMNAALPPAFAALLYYAGVLMEKAKRNWFIGVRTPWTLSSDAVWEKTNRLGGKLFKACAVISLAGLLFPDHAILLLLAPAIAAAIYATAYSYLEYRKEAQKK